MKEQLGSGAYSIVYACVDKMTGERHAVKCIRKNALKANDIEALKNEVLIMGRLNHKNIVRLEGFYEDNEQYYIVTELVGGRFFIIIPSFLHPFIPSFTLFLYTMIGL